MSEVDIPSYFLCPISLQVMKDPVILCTGITYDRSSIEHWLFTKKHYTCPVTNQFLSDFNLTPNHTLHRLIRSWCPQQKNFVDEDCIVEVLKNGKGSIQELKLIVMESEKVRQCVESSSHILDFLISFLGINDEALCILSILDIPEELLQEIAPRNNNLVDTLTNILHASCDVTRVNAVIFLKKLISVITPTQLASTKEALFEEIVRVLSDKISIQATKATLEVLHGLCPWGKNTVKAISASAVHALVDQLIDERQNKRVIEMVLMVLERLCMCAEGRAKIVGNAVGIASVSEKIYMNSLIGSERAVKILHTICKYSATRTVLREMIEVGAVSRLCMILLIDSSSKTKRRAREILKMHSCVWRKSPSFSPPLFALYPN